MKDAKKNLFADPATLCAWVMLESKTFRVLQLGSTRSYGWKPPNGFLLRLKGNFQFTLHKVSCEVLNTEQYHLDQTQKTNNSAQFLLIIYTRDIYIMVLTEL